MTFHFHRKEYKYQTIQLVKQAKEKLKWWQNQHRIFFVSFNFCLCSSLFKSVFIGNILNTFSPNYLCFAYGDNWQVISLSSSLLTVNSP